MDLTIKNHNSNKKSTFANFSKMAVVNLELIASSLIKTTKENHLAKTTSINNTELKFVIIF